MSWRVAWRASVVAGILVVGAAGGCGSDDSGAGGAGSGGSGGSGGKPVEPVPLDPTEFTYTLDESGASLTLWTTPPTRKVTRSDAAPSAKRSGLRLDAAKNEFEPAQLVLGPGSGDVKVEVAPFADLGSAQRVSLSAAAYDGDVVETLSDLASGGSVSLDATSGTVLWLTVYVPDGAAAGDHQTTLTLTPSGGAPVSVPVRLHVFDFALPKDVHFASQLNLSVQGLIPNGGSEEGVKTMLYEHRLTPASPTWPSGFKWNITWENDASPTKCSAFFDEPNEAPPYSIKSLAKKYILGEGWNGVGFPDSELFQFVDNSTPRPQTFCGVDRGPDHLGTAAYNAAWSAYLSALDAYLVQNGYEDKSYYYVQNEPQDAADLALAAHLCRLTKKAAPHLRIAISEEPKPEIAEDPGGACGYDIWIAHVRAYEEKYAWKRQKDFGERVWFYSLDQDPDPYFNPTRTDTQGLHERIIPWAAWSHRISGWAYYDGGRFFHGTTPGVRAELLREGFEDYEYLYLANGTALPKVDVTEVADPTVKSVAASMTSWTKDPDALMALRYELGRYIEGSRSTLPVLQADSGIRPRGAYYVNFQDPAGQPSADPLSVDGKTWMKVGWEPYDEKKGLGWSGEKISDPAIALFGFDDVAGYSDVQKSYVYDDYGRDNLFEFALEPGKYSVTVGVGRPAKGYPNDPHNVSIEGVKVIDDELTTDAAPTIERTTIVDLTDGSLSLVVGGKSASTGNYAYTFLAYLAVEPAG
jgi:hypothetical protein